MARHATEEEEEEKAFADRTGEMRLCQSQTEGSGRLLLGFNLEQGLTWSSSYLLFGSGLDYHSGNTLPLLLFPKLIGIFIVQYNSSV